MERDDLGQYELAAQLLAHGGGERAWVLLDREKSGLGGSPSASTLCSRLEAPTPSKARMYGRLWAGLTAMMASLAESHKAPWLLWSVESSLEPFVVSRLAC